jgi:hypothetical protein
MRVRLHSHLRVVREARMELLTRPNSLAPWAPRPPLLAGLREAAEGSAELLLFSRSPDTDLDEILAALWVFERCGGRASSVYVATACPDAEWTAELRRRGVAGIFVGRRTRTGIEIEREVPRRVCPSLHARRVPGGALSVCGEHADRRVLADVHHARWCLGEFERCPSRARSHG